LVTRARRNSNALSGQQENPLTIGLHHGLAGQNKEKLSSVSVEVKHLGAGRHALLNHAQARTQQ
jgi:hypothetical protein